MALDVTELANYPPWEWPESAGEAIKKTLRDRASAGRTVAAGLGGDLVVMDDEMADLLASIVEDTAEPNGLRERAAIALGPVLEQCWIEGYDLEDDLSEPPIEEKTFDRIRATLRRIYENEKAPKTLRRRALEAAIRAEDSWHPDAVRKAYSSGDEEWKLTGVFCMQYLEGFDAEILESLSSTNPDIHYEAVRAAGTREVKAAWPHILSLLKSKRTPKSTLIAALQAAAEINPSEAAPILDDFTLSEDEDIAEAADEALTMANTAEGEWDGDEDDEDEDEEDDEEE